MTNYTARNEMIIYRRRRALTAVFFLILFAAGLLLGGYFFRETKTVNQTQTPVLIPYKENTQSEQTDTTGSDAQQNTVTVIEDYEIDDSMVAWGDAYSTVFRQGGSKDIRTGIDNKTYDYAICPNRQELILDVGEAKGYLKGTFVLSAFNKSDSYFRDIEIEIYDVGADDPFSVSVMDSDTRSDIDLSVKLSGHSRIAIRFGYAGGDVYLATNGLYISEAR